jgi:hypothetical protein
MESPPYPIHGRIRGLDNTPRSSTEDGRFGRLFRRAPALCQPPERLRQLAETMQGEGPRADTALGTPDDEENPAIPAGYTYLGQFIDHDLTFDPVASFDRQNDPEARTNFRTPRFDLDSLYGRGPADQPYLYLDGVRFLLGKRLFDGNEPVSCDLPRNSQQRALIGDPRNDENKIVSQLHATMLRLHNAFVERGAAAGLTGEGLFHHAQQATRWHYQYVVLNDFLRRITGQDKYGAITRAREQRTLYRPRCSAFIPVEFSVAAYRFGHSMVRPSYLFNDGIRPKDGGVGTKDDHVPHRLPIFSPEPQSRSADMRGFGEFPDDWGFRWKYFFEMESQPHLPQPSYRIDTKLSDPLSLLRTVRVVDNDPPSLALRNLMRSQQLGLPSAQDVAQRLGITPLGADELFPLPTDEQIAEGEAMDPALRTCLLATFGTATPLWYYILREAEEAGGAHLGALGARVVAEVFVGLLEEDRSSYLNLAPGWTPAAADGGADFKMPDLLRIAAEAPSEQRAAAPRR